MAKWCSVTVTFTPRGYTQSYKRDIAVHNHNAAAAFVIDAKTDSLNRVNAQRPQNNQVGLNQLGTTGLAVYEANDPGVNYRLI